MLKHRIRKRIPPEKRFWKFVKKTKTCWLWTGYTMEGYGRFSLETNRQVLAHRYAYELVKGKIPKGKDLLHNCNPKFDRKNCVNPDHLRPGNMSQNQIDSVMKGTHFMKLTPSIVMQIRHLYTGIRGEQKKLAKKFHISRGTIGDIVNRRRWKHLEST